MPARVVCPSCARTLQADASMIGVKLRCGGCGQVFVASAESFAGPDDVPMTLDVETADDRHSGKAVASLTMGLIGLLGWCVPIVGLPLGITGLVLGIKGLKSSNAGMATAGIVLCVITIVLSVANAAVGGYLAATGQYPGLQRR